MLLILSLTVVVAAIGEFAYEQRSGDSVRGKCRVKCWDRREDLVVGEILSVTVDGVSVDEPGSFLGSSAPVKFELSAHTSGKHGFQYFVSSTDGTELHLFGASLVK